MSKPCKACAKKDKEIAAKDEIAQGGIQIILDSWKEIARLEARIIAPCEECQGVGSIERIHEDRAYYDPCKVCAGGRVVIADAT